MQKYKHKVGIIICFVSSALSICDKANFAAIDCSEYSFLITINQTCFNYHWNRGNAWNENIIFGSSGAAACELNVASQGANTIEINFDQCDVVANYPDPTNKTIIDFNLDGHIIETLIGNADIETLFDFNYKCEFRGVTDLEESAQLYDADKLKVNDTLTLDSSIIPNPVECLTKDESGEQFCSNDLEGSLSLDDLQVGDTYDFYWDSYYPSLGSMSFRIENVWLGPVPGEKTVQIASDGCLLSPFDSGFNWMSPDSRLIQWTAFKFKSSSSVHFTFELVMCDAGGVGGAVFETTFCLGSTQCETGEGNQYLFEQWLSSNNQNRKRKSADDENNPIFQPQQIVEISDISVEVKLPENANLREENVNGETVIVLSDEAGVNTARKNMNAKEYDMADKWAAHKSNGRLARRVGNEPVTYAPDNINIVHDKFLVREAHDQTQVEIPVVDYLTETNLVKQN
ncbi:Oidioi.mRNA.OKI2018_I69.PAR.g8821.t1.cds [Oikopleura dioica]|uniref:Oidioi.mRNA.OKI2018_I69.PAR.g8821.t1.cds n=1 Tax=Oikopleura dioica TaxID=34765 RepID=A0ABN7RHT5_OIKDI|nr:Oidioi.mRNA.OKI2018_I69.PAR.g8821.t1.cds [Oikopleura dioica]